MRAIRSRLTYSNVLASIAMFLALTGGTVMAAKLRSKDLAANSVKKKQLAKNSVTKNDFAKGALIVSSATGGGQIPNATATPPASGFPLPLSGKTSFTPKKGAVGLLMAEAKATLASAAPPANCDVTVQILVNGEPAVFLFLTDVPFSAPPPGDSTGAPYTSANSGSAPIGLTGGTQQITAQYNGDPDCTGTSKIDQVKVLVQRSR